MISLVATTFTSVNTYLVPYVPSARLLRINWIQVMGQQKKGDDDDDPKNPK